MTVPRAAVRAVEVSRAYGTGGARVHALDRVSLDVQTGRLTAVMGPSGSGKSTLLHCLAALDRPTSGEVYLGSRPLSRMSDDQLTRLRRDRIGFVFQSFNLVPTLTARENILLPMSLAGRRPSRQWFDHVVDTVGLRDRLRHRPAQLSGGQQQRVACARAMLSRPAVVFADEPTGNLDSAAAAQVLRLLRYGVEAFGQTVVMVTHDPGAAEVADRVVMLADGRVADDLDRPVAAQVLERMAALTRPRAARAV